MPPGVLASGAMYYAVITAQQAAWDTVDVGMYRFGLPYHFADCVSHLFAP